MTGWAWITRFLATELDADAGDPGIEHALSGCRCTGRCVPAFEIPTAAEVNKFQRMLVRADRGRIRHW